MQHLKTELDNLLATLPNVVAIRHQLKSLVSFYPFNEYEFIIAHLLAKGVMSLEQYTNLRDKYLERNPHGKLYSLGSTAFGTTWAHRHIMDIIPPLTKAKSNKHDLLLDDIQVELKASRAVERAIQIFYLKKRYNRLP